MTGTASSGDLGSDRHFSDSDDVAACCRLMLLRALLGLAADAVSGIIAGGNLEVSGFHLLPVLFHRAAVIRQVLSVPRFRC